MRRNQSGIALQKSFSCVDCSSGDRPWQKKHSIKSIGSRRNGNAATFVRLVELFDDGRRFFDAIRELMTPIEKPKHQIDFHQ